MIKKFYSGNAPELEKYKEMCLDEGAIESELYTKYSVNRGLRDLNGKGVLTGLTEISEIQSKMNVDGVDVPCEGMLLNRLSIFFCLVHCLMKSGLMNLKPFLQIIVNCLFHLSVIL